MSAISETYTAVIIFWNMFLSQKLKRKVIITNENDDKKYEMTDELPTNVKLKKTSNLHGVKV